MVWPGGQRIDGSLFFSNRLNELKNIEHLTNKQMITYVCIRNWNRVFECSAVNLFYQNLQYFGWSMMLILQYFYVRRKMTLPSHLMRHKRQLNQVRVGRSRFFFPKAVCGQQQNLRSVGKPEIRVFVRLPIWQRGLYCV